MVSRSNASAVIGADFQPNAPKTPVSFRAFLKKPRTTWEMDERLGEPRQITTLVIVVADLEPKQLRRLARAALEECPLDVGLLPQIEQAEFDVDKAMGEENGETA